MNDKVEAVAREICASVPGTGEVDEHFTGKYPSAREMWMSMACAAIAAMEGAEPVAWRVPVKMKDGKHTSIYIEALPFEPLTDGEVVNWGEPLPLFAHPLPEPIAEARAEGWRSIETAPKDGTWIMAYRPNKGFGGCMSTVLTVCWREDVGKWVWPDMAFDIFEGDLDEQNEKGCHVFDLYEDDSFTLWMPIPAPTALRQMQPEAGE